MTKVYESAMHAFGIDFAERIHIYEVEDENEHECLDSMTYAELCAYFDVPKSAPIGLLPGSLWSTYSFQLTDTHMIVMENVTYNV